MPQFPVTMSLRHSELLSKIAHFWCGLIPRLLMAIHRSGRFPQHANVLPTSWFTLYSLNLE